MESPDEPELPRPSSGQTEQANAMPAAPVQPAEPAEPQAADPEPTRTVDAVPSTSAAPEQAAPTPEQPVAGLLEVRRVARIMDPLNPKRSLAEIHGCEPAAAEAEGGADKVRHL